MNHYLIPSGVKKQMQPLNREFFFDTEEGNLYIRYNDQWVLIGGSGKQDTIVPGDNLEILYEKTDPYQFEPTLRLKDNIDIDTWTLGKFSNTIEYKGLYLLGTVEDCSIFPLIEKSESELGTGLGGKIITYIQRGNDIERAQYHLTVQSNLQVSIFGGSNKNITLHPVLATIDDQSIIGLRTVSSSKKDIRMGKDEIPPFSFSIWFSGWDYRETTPNLNIKETDIQSIRYL